jgi:hypothetical protein
VLSEQATGSIGFLRLFGLVNEDFYDLSVLLLVAAVAGAITAALLITPDRITHLVMWALGLVAIASYFDSFSSDLTRARQFYATQTVIAFATTLFIGPALIFGIKRVVAQGAQKLSSFVILFAITQSLGSLGGNATVLSFQLMAERSYSARLVSQVTGINPLVGARISATASAYSPIIADPALQTAEAAATLAQETTLQSNILAYNDVFRLIALLAAGTSAFLACQIVGRWLAAFKVERSSHE